MPFGVAVALVALVAQATPVQLQRAENLVVPGTVLTATFPAVTTPGNVLIIVLNFEDPNDPTLVDDQGHVLTPLTPTPNAHTYNSRLFILEVPLPVPRSLTATGTVPGRIEIIAAEYSGLPVPPIIESRSSAVGDGPAASSGPVSTNPGSLLFGAALVSGAVIDPGTLIVERSRFDGDFYGDAISTAAGTVEFNLTMGGWWFCHLVSLSSVEPIDAGTPDAGAPLGDAGVPDDRFSGPKSYLVDRACSASPGLGWLAALSWWLRRRVRKA